MKIETLLIAAAFVFQTLVPREAWAWGEYGHEQINRAAIQLLKAENEPSANMSSSDEDVVKRLAITPDIDWKMIGRPPKSETKLEEKHLSDSMEHPLHFFEADAFEDPAKGQSSLSALPSGDYGGAAPLLQAALVKNQKAVIAADPGKPLDSAAHGSAPWRILQLYDLGLAALKGRDYSKAALYFGALGHYVGDMSQPFHTTMDFDGAAYPRPAAGIHSIFEEKILEDAAHQKAGRDPKNERTSIWDVSATNEKVLRFAREAYGGGAPVPRERIVAEVLDLVRGGYVYIEPLLGAYARECMRAQKGLLAVRAEAANASSAPFCVPQPKDPKDPHPAVRTSVGLIRAFSSAKVTGSLTAFELAEKRMGQGAALLARIWKQAYNDAGRPSLGRVNITFGQLNVNSSYPKPQYLGDAVVSRPARPDLLNAAQAGDRLGASMNRLRAALGD